MPDATIGAAYALTLVATGGTPPLSWTANGLPEGLLLNPSTGAVSGVPAVGGPLSFTVKVTDSAQVSAIDLFHLNIALPRPPSLAIRGLPSIASPAEQPAIRVAIDAPFPVPISGQLLLTFAPEIGAGDSTIQFLTGGRTTEFTIPSGALEAVFASGGMAIQTGTVAGTISVSAQFSAGGVDLTPDPQPICTTQVARAAPVITAVGLTRTSTGFDVVLTGFATAREVTQAVFRFKAAGGNTLENGEVTVAVENAFAAWYRDTASLRYGSQFAFTQPFTVRGDASMVTLESASLTNRFGTAESPLK
jgi:hypothetical protein